MKQNKKGGLGRKPKDHDPQHPVVNGSVIEGGATKKSHLLIPLCVGGAIILGGAFFLTVNSSSIEMICRQVGNCQRFKEDANKAQDSFKKAEDRFKTAKSVQNLLTASKSIDEAKNNLLTIPDSAIELVSPISDQKAKVIELDKKIAIALALEQNADKALKEAILRIANADKLNRNPQEETEPPDDAKKRLNKPKALYVEAQVLLRSIPDDSFIAISKKEKLKQLFVKIQDVDGKLGEIKALDPCVTNPAACVVPAPEPVDFCEANPAACQQPSTPPTKRPLFGPGSSGY